MPAAPAPADEKERLGALNESGLLDRRADPRLQTLTELAGSLLQRPNAAFSLIGQDRQVFRATSGFSLRSAPREGSPCAYAILQPDRPLVVNDAREDGRLADSPLVTGDFGLRFYAGLAVRSANGQPLGALCVLDRVPGSMTGSQVEILRGLAAKTELLIQQSRPVVHERRSLLQDLRHAVLARAFTLEWQAIVGARTLRVDGYEALIRWRRPTGENVAPDRFIPVAEASGLIGRLDRLVLETACADAARRAEAHGISVNVSSRWFRAAKPALPALVASILSKNGWSPERLTLEVTERVLIADPDRARMEMLALKALGVRLALDDFGTGYSSLSTLESFPFDVVKLDKSFVRGLGSNPRAEAVARAVIRLGQELGITVCAEGVEKEAQLGFLQREGCDLVQGYLTGRPTPLASIEEEQRPSP